VSDKIAQAIKLLMGSKIFSLTI